MQNYFILRIMELSRHPCLNLLFSALIAKLKSIHHLTISTISVNHATGDWREVGEFTIQIREAANRKHRLLQRGRRSSNVDF